MPLVEPRSFCIVFDFSGFWRIIIPFVAQGATLLSRYIRQNFIVLLRLHRAPNVPLRFFGRRSGLLSAIFDKTPKKLHDRRLSFSRYFCPMADFLPLSAFAVGQYSLSVQSFYAFPRHCVDIFDRRFFPPRSTRLVKRRLPI